MSNHTLKNKISPSSVYYCPMECEGEKLYFVQDKRCPVCNMYLLPIEEKEEFKNRPQAYSETNLPKNFNENEGKYYCPMFCEGDKIYDENIGCPICGMDLVQIPSKQTVIKKDNTIAKLSHKLWISVVCTIIVMLLSMGGMFISFPFSNKTQGGIELFFTLPVLFYSGWFIIKRGWNSFLTWNLNMFSLIALGVISAFVFSVIALFLPSIFPHEMMHDGKYPLYFEAVCTILSLVIVGQLMEAKAHKKTSKAIENLINLTPNEANLVENNQERKVAISEVKVGDVLRVKAGEKIPVDGKILEGSVFIDESMITGEPIPVQKKTEDSVISGTLNGNGTFLMVAEKIGAETLLSKIIDMVNTASRSRAPIQKLADKVSKIFVPAVLVISVITFTLWLIFGGENGLTLAFLNAVAVLVVACPCALGLATPMSIMVGIGKAAQNGILIKNAEAIEILNATNVFITDKTGTLTEGKPTLRQVISQFEKNEILKLSASLSRYSEHPLSHALLNDYKIASSDNTCYLPIHHFENIAGRGISGFINDERYLLGNETLMKEYGVEMPNNTNEESTTSYFARNKELIATFIYEDRIKPQAKEAISYLKNKGIEVIMMTGDNLASAKAVAEEIGIEKYFVKCLPQDKMNKIEQLQNSGHIVAMAGDGINDAPALAKANIGIAMGTGSDIAIESAGITLLNGSIQNVGKALILSHNVLKNIKQNLFFAFIYNLLGVPIAAGLLYPFFGILLSPMIAATAMSFSSVSVIINSLRLNKADLSFK